MGEVKEYIHLFETENEYNTKRNFDYLEPWVSYTEESTKVNYNMTEEERKFSTPLTFEITGDGDIYWKAKSDNSLRTIEYKKNDEDWKTITSSTGGTYITVSSGDTVLFRAPQDVTYTTLSDTYDKANFFSGCTCTFNVKGNVMSLLDANNFSTMSSLTASLVFTCLFRYCTGLTDASKLILPADNLTFECYREMFANCSNLVGVPKLPAMNLGEGCYNGMFHDCTNLTTVPELPATTLASNCYDYMFASDTGLTDASGLVLPATTLANNCYSQMFRGCTSLTTTPELPATTLADRCYYYMFRQCTGLTTAPELPATTLADGCYYRMFYGCTSLTTPPELPATTLVNECYRGMFGWCTELNYIKCLATDISATDCTLDWVESVASSGTFVAANDGVDWTIGVNGIPVNWKRINEKSQPLTFEITGDGTIYWGTLDTGFTRTIEYSKDNGSTWTSITSTRGDGTPIQVVSGDTLQFRGNNANYATYPSGGKKISFNTFIGSTAQFKVKGNIMSLINSTNFGTLTTLESAYTFYGLFTYCTGLTDASELLLPATTLADYCYGGMFQGCTSLTTAPLLPATTLTEDCYSNMFGGCTNLTTAPQLPATILASECYYNMFNDCTSLTTVPTLPATTLADYCYDGMFYGCTSLITAPSLPATTLTEGCYEHMFRGCTGLTTVPSLPATILADYCYQSMFYDCTNLTTAPELPATTLASYCYDGMFQGCTGLTTAPELPATTLVDYCYDSMFFQCTSLTTAPELPATTLTEGCYEYMFRDCTGLTTVPSLPATILADYCYQSMFQDCTSLNYIKCLATDISANSCTYGWVSGVASSGTFVKNPSMASWTTGTSGIPTGWTTLLDDNNTPVLG